MDHRILAFLAFVLAISLAACQAEPPEIPEEQDELATMVSFTLTANAVRPTATQSPTDTPFPTASATATSTPSPTDTPTPTPTIPPFNVSGTICYPDGEIPAMTIYFEETENERLVELPVAGNQEAYEVKLPAGTYIAYAWLKDFSRGGLYSRAVPCGLGNGCDDHALMPFTVSERELLTGIDLCDWFAGPFNVPYPPGVEQAELTGSISGTIDHPDEEPPDLRVVAFNQETNYWYWVSNQPGQSTYTLTKLPPGPYHIVAYDSNGNAGGHADSRHNLIEIVVESGKTSLANITDWNAPLGSFPADPTRD